MSVLTTDLSDTFEQIGLDVKNIGTRVFLSRADAEAADIPPTLRHISVIHNGIVCNYIKSDAHTALTTADGATWGPADDFYYAEHYGCTPLDKGNGATGAVNPDVHEQLQRSINENAGTHCRTLKLTGYVRVTDALVMPASTVTNGTTVDFNIVGTRELEQCGIAIRDDFNMSAEGVIDCGDGPPGIHIDEMSFWFVQPDVLNSYADVIQYPPAINGSNSPRGHIGKIRIIGGWNGVDLHDDTPRSELDSNPGHWRIDHIQSSCYNYTLWASNALGFVTVGTIHKWFYNLGAAGFALQAFGVTRALVCEDNDNITVSNLECFQSGVEINGSNYDNSNDGHMLPVTISNLMLDGDGSCLYLNGASSLIGNYYSTNGAQHDHAQILCTGGEHFISNASIKTADADSIVVSGGALTINGGRLVGGWNGAPAQNKIIARVTDGQLNLQNMTFESFTGERTSALVQQSGTGVLRVRDCNIHNVKSSGGLFVGISTDTGCVVDCPEFDLEHVAFDVNYLKNVIRTRNKNIDATENASHYDTHSVFSDTSTHYPTDYAGKGRGTIDAPANVAQGDVTKDFFVRAWHTGAWRNTGLLRNYVDSIGTYPIGAWDLYVGDGTGGAQKRVVKHSATTSSMFNMVDINPTNGQPAPLRVTSGSADIVALFTSIDPGADLMITDDLGATRLRNTAGEFSVFTGNGPGLAAGGAERFRVSATYSASYGGSFYATANPSPAGVISAMESYKGTTGPSGWVGYDVPVLTYNISPSTELVVSKAGGCNMTLLTDSSGTSRYSFGDNDLESAAWWQFNHSSQQMNFGIASDSFLVMRYAGAGKIVNLQGQVDLSPYLTEGGQIAFRNNGGTVSHYAKVDVNGELSIRAQSGNSILLGTAGVIKLKNLPTFADDAAAAALETDQLYKTATGELRIKL